LALHTTQLNLFAAMLSSAMKVPTVENPPLLLAETAKTVSEDLTCKSGTVSAVLFQLYFTVVGRALGLIYTIKLIC
jgi:hypothetical protein